MFTKKNILMITIKYLIQSKSKTAPIYIYISAGRGKLYKRKTREMISPCHWNNKKGSVKTLTALPTETPSKSILLLGDIIKTLPKGRVSIQNCLRCNNQTR